MPAGNPSGTLVLARAGVDQAHCRSVPGMVNKWLRVLYSVLLVGLATFRFFVDLDWRVSAVIGTVALLLMIADLVMMKRRAPQAPA